MTPSISVLMPVFNERPEFLDRAVQSIFAQGLQTFELLLVDDGSDAPETLTAIARLAQSDDRCRVLRVDHIGLTRCLNRGMRECRAELVCRHDSDDWSEPDRFARQVEFLNARPDCALVGSQAWLHQEDGTPLWITNLPLEAEATLRTFQSSNPFVHGAAMFRRHAAFAVGGYRPMFVCSQDYDFFWRLCEKAGGANLPLPLYHHRKTAGSISTQRALEQARTVQVTRRLALLRARGGTDDLENVPAEVTGDLEAIPNAGAVAFRNADGLMLAGHYRRALASYARGIAKSPLSPAGYLKLGRCLAFILLPPLRKRLFA